MTFQNLLSRIHKWNSTIIEEERKRIIDKSGCNYLEDLITCVHIIQLKVLTCIRVGNKQKKIDISIPKLDDFIHKVYIHVARKIYSNVYLFEKNIIPLQYQRNNRELETIVQECIMVAIRDSIPTEAIIRSYLDETMEHEEEILIEKIAPEPEVSKEKTDKDKDKDIDPPNEEKLEDEKTPPMVPVIENLDEKPVITKLTFQDNNRVMEYEKESAPIDTMKNSIETISKMNTEPKFSPPTSFINADGDDDDYGRLKISSEDVDISCLDFLDMDPNGNIKLDFEEI
jgi:hypothetical protein